MTWLCLTYTNEYDEYMREIDGESRKIQRNKDMEKIDENRTVTITKDSSPEDRTAILLSKKGHQTIELQIKTTSLTKYQRGDNLDSN